MRSHLCCKRNLNRSPTISDSLLKSSFLFLFSNGPPNHLLVLQPPHSLTLHHLLLIFLSLCCFQPWLLLLLLLLFLIGSCSCFLCLRTAFYLLCCVVHTVHSNGERVKWKCWGSGPCSACLSAALVNATVRCAQIERQRGDGVNIRSIFIHVVVDSHDRLKE